MPKVTVNLLPLWQEKERELGKSLSVRRVSAATGLDWKTVANLKAGETTRIDLPKIAPLCEYFGVEHGQPVPFLLYYNND